MNGVVYTAPREWTRVHPISPYLGSGPILGFVAVYALARVTPNWVVGQSDEYEALNQVPVTVPGAGAGTDLYIKQDQFRRVFAADVPRMEAALMAATQRPITSAALSGSLDQICSS